MSNQHEPPKLRDVKADRRKAIEDAIAAYTSLGREPTPYLVQKLADLDATEGRIKVAVTPTVTAELERKDADPPAETAVPSKPSRPKKPDVDSTAGR